MLVNLFNFDFNFEKFPAEGGSIRDSLNSYSGWPES